MKLPLYDETFSRSVMVQLFALTKDALLGEFRSVFKGEGIEFHENRKYQWGDSIRSLNWTLFAKLNQLYVKEFIEDRNRFNLILLDCTPSMFYKSNYISKIAKSLEVAMILLYSSLQIKDYTSLILFTDHIIKMFPFKNNIQYFYSIYSYLKTCEIEPVKTDNFNQILQNIYNLLQKRTNVFIISDFFLDSFIDELNIVAQKHKLIGINIFDQNEEMIASTVSEVNSIENPSRMFNTDHYPDYVPEYLNVQNLFIKKGLDFIRISTQDHGFVELQKYFKSKLQRNI